MADSNYEKPDASNGDGMTAWFIACLAVGGAIGGLFGLMALPGGITAFPILFMSALIAIPATMLLTATPAFLLVQLARAAGWRRGFADVLITAGLSLLVGAVVSGGHPVALFLAPLGALGGWVYWTTAGRPGAPGLKDGEQL